MSSKYDYDGYGFYPESQPIPTSDGIKAASQRGKFAETWWAERWISTLERLIDAGRLRRSKKYARQGQVLSIDPVATAGPAGVMHTSIRAEVQGSRPIPYKVTLALEPLSDEAWTQVIDALAEQAIFTAQLLAGEMPHNIEQIFSSVGVSLFPDRAAELRTECSCPDYANPCKHIAAVHYILGEQFDANPFLIFLLRGRSQEQILTALSQRHTQTEAAEETELPEDVPLEQQLSGFWGSSAPIHLDAKIEQPTTEVPILRRLDKPAFLDEDSFQTLGKMIRSISQAAIKAAYSDPETGEPFDGDR